MWTALFSVTFFAVVIALGDIISTKTRGVVATVLVAMVVYVIGFNLGWIPTDSLTNTGLLTITGTFGMLATVTNLGTMVEIRSFFKEWKIVVLCLVSLGVMGLVFVTVGSALFGRTYALAAYPPVAGGMTATVMIADHGTSIGMPELGSFAWFLVTLQMFVGIPVASWFLKRHAQSLLAAGGCKDGAAAQEDAAKKNIWLPPVPAKYNSNHLILAKVLIVTCLSQYLGTVTPVPAAIFCLVLGVLGAEVGFLDRQALQKCGMLNLVMFAMMSSAPNSFATLSFSALFEMVLPVVFFLVTGALSLGLGGAVAGKLLHIPTNLAVPLALNAMFGFPFNIMITDDVVRTTDATEEEKQYLRNVLQPQMTIAGFVSMTIMSVVIAAVVIPFIV